MMNHINEHLGFAYRVQIEQQLGMTLPPQKDESGEDINMPPEVEARLAPMLAQAATRLLQQNQAQVAQQQAQQQAQYPIVQLQQKELEIKDAEQKRKAAKDLADINLEKKRLDIDAMKALGNIKQQKANRNIDALKSAAQVKQQKEQFQNTQRLDALKTAAEMAHAHVMTNKQHAHAQQTKTENTNKPNGE
jgi:hypothetical protein